MKPSSALIIQTAFLGDVILTTPLIDALAQAYPGIFIDFLTIPVSVNTIETHPALRHIFAYDKRGNDAGLSGILRMARMLKQQNYDICLCPHRSLRSAYLTFRTKAKIRIGFHNSSWRGGFTDLVPYRQNHHEIERNLSLLKPLDISLPLSKPTVVPDTHDRHIVEQQVNTHAPGQQNTLFAVAPGSIWPTKRWPKRHFADFCKRLIAQGWIPVLIGSEDDYALCSEIVKLAGGGMNLAGKISIRQTGYLLSRCRGLLTNDSAPLHLAMAFDIPVFAIFGATIPEFGFGPFGPKGFVLERKDVGCRPCGIHGGKKCPVKTFECMEQINADEVFTKVNTYFATVDKSF